MTALLTDNLPMLAGAPNGIKKLRELILELAVRGKLVPQDPSDEPASELLKRIAEEKARLLTAGKKLKQQVEINEQEKPFSVPQGWNWVRLGSCLEMINGRAFKPTEWIAAGLPIVRIQNLNKPDAPFNYCNPDTVDDRHVIDTGTILISWSGTPGTSFGAFIWERGKAALNQHIFSCFQVGDAFFDKFLKLAINTRLEELIAKAHGGVGLQHVTKGKLEALTLVLPPIAEQHRIVAKVDELMALCDRLEAQQADAESARTQLVQALLDSLTHASDTTAFAANWQRLAEHFHTLFITEPSIDALKQTLLQLAVMGKLMPQDPSDEPASELLRRIAEERESYVAGRRSAKDTALLSIDDTEKTFELPSGWEWVRLQQIISVSSGDGLVSANMKVEGGIPVYGGNGVTGYHDEKNIDKATLVIGRVGYYCGSIHLTPASAWITDNALIVSFSEENIYKNFLFWLLKATNLKEQENATAQPVISGRKIHPIVLAIPPLAEQQRIVAKVDQLMTLCDQLRTRLTQARQLNEQMASTLVELALAEDGKQAPITTDQKTARTLLAAEVTHRLHAQRTFGQRKLQKVVYLVEHAARLEAIQGSYLRNVAGPHDRHLMNQVEAELQKHQWYERIDRETVGHAYRPLSQAGQHRRAYNCTWSAKEHANIEQVIELMRDWDTDRCEMTVTLYAAWNDFIIEGRPVTDEAIVDEVMHRWNEAKLRFSKGEWLAVLTEMKKHGLLTPTGFGKRTSGGTLTLPGFG